MDIRTIYDNVEVYDDNGSFITMGRIVDLGDTFFDIQFEDECGNMHTLSPLSYEYKVGDETICPEEIGAMANAWRATA